MVGHGGSSAVSYLADPTSPIPSHCASIVVTSTVRVNAHKYQQPADILMIEKHKALHWALYHMQFQNTSALYEAIFMNSSVNKHKSMNPRNLYTNVL